MAPHFRYEITDDGFSFERDEASIAAEAQLNGIYVIRTSAIEDELGAEEVARAYTPLSVVEQAFRVSKDVEVKLIRHRGDDRVRAHVFLCMLAFYVRRHMEEALAPMLFVDHDRAGAEAERTSVVAPAVRSPRSHCDYHTLPAGGRSCPASRSGGCSKLVSLSSSSASRSGWPSLWRAPLPPLRFRRPVSRPTTHLE